MTPAPRVLTAGAIIAAAMLIAAVAARAEPQAPPEARVVVTGEGSVVVAPDEARIRSGVVTRARTAREATDANNRQMAAVVAALRGGGIEEKDIQTSRFSVQPVYGPVQANAEPRLTGFTVSNQVTVLVRQVGAVSAVLDRIIAAGANDVGSVEFLHADLSKALDQAREAAVADARRKAELYARAAGRHLGPVQWITEDSAYAPSPGLKALRAGVAMAAPVPIAAGEDTLQVRITVGFDMSS